MPRKIGLYWFIPAFAKRSVGSLWGTTEEEGHGVWPLDSKKSTKAWRTRAPCSHLMPKA